jgi:rhodanese-related sulfurtransferase
LIALADGGAQILDTRSLEQFEAAHLRGAINIGLDGRYATWCGTVLAPERSIAIVADPGLELESVVRLGRIGFDHVAGYLSGGMAALATRPELVASVERLAPSALTERLRAEDPPLLLDVRTPSEFEQGAIEGSENMPLGRLGEAASTLPRGRPIVVYCESGYRSVIGASLLQSVGFTQVADLAGGMAAWESAPAGA